MPSRPFVLASVLLVASVPACSPSPKPVLVPPADERLRYLGRVDRSATGPVRFDWPGTGVVARFESASLSVHLRDSLNHFNVYLDGRLIDTLPTRPGRTLYPIAADLPPGPHTLRLVRRTEANQGVSVFEGLQLGGAGRLLEPPPAPARHLWFIGDSITCGYGVEGANPDCPFSAATENVEQSYAALVADAFEAGYHITAYSGRGLVRNYGDSVRTSAEPLPALLDRTLVADTESRWDPAGWRPDAVVINLGTNDFSTTPHPTRPVFLNAFDELLGRIRERHGAVPIFVIAGPLMQEPAPAYLQAAVDAARAHGDAAVHLVASPPLDRPGDFGCDWHPNRSGQRKIAAPLVATMTQVLDWQPTLP